VITRDNAASISGTAQNTRQRLGEVIQHYREERGVSRRDAAHRCKVAVSLVEQWEDGKALPSSDEWKALTRGVHRGLTRFDDLYNRARIEADNEARERAKGSMQTNGTKITTSLGDKIAAAIAPTPAPALAVVPAPVAQPEADKRQRTRRLPPPPPGAMSEAQCAKRADYVRKILRERPHARAYGPDGVIDLVRATFGVGVSPVTIEDLRAEVLAERQGAAVPSTLPPIDQVSAPVAAEVKRQMSEVEQHARAPRDVEAEISSAVQLLMDAIPNLQTFTISVDDHGEASVDYQIRKVVITTTGGSLKVKR
jgi:transcriptional regulator with XRE-family HTH domain